MKIGDIVRLRSGGPAMTIETLGDKLVGVVWFDQLQDLRRANLLRSQLVKVEAVHV